MSITSEAGRDGWVIQLEGDVNITEAAKLKHALLEALGSRQPIEVHMAGAIDLDLTAIQVLLAATREAEKAGVKLELAGIVQEAIMNTLHDAGCEHFPQFAPTAGQASAEAASSGRENDRQI